MSVAASLLATMFSPALDSGGAADWCRSAVGAGAADTVQPSVRKVQCVWLVATTRRHVTSTTSVSPLAMNLLIYL
ncbi:hypothetical protein R3P38DRAFT_1332066 [Favolaschia claudopus]|uniref:Secreted protein n=1 Tax=Favolaschia claudopus TaxID=2862362 RepID=A0AAW0AUR2_9AGAR